MADVKINYGKGVVRVLIDGHDLTRSIHADGFEVNFPPAPGGEVSVTMTIAATTLEMNLPEAVILATRSEGVA